MDIESFKPLLSILAWGALFFFMMRFGCGAHVMGRHGHHGSGAKREDDASSPAKDPVCGMSVDAKTARAAAVHDGTTYYFCSDTCREKFDKSPASYSGRVPDENAHGGHHG